MRTNIMKAAARTAVAGAVLTLGLGSAQAAMAKPAPAVVNVPCSATVLASDIAGAVGGETLSLVKFCTYQLHAALPAVKVDLTIRGNEDTVERSYLRGTPDFSIFTVLGAAFVLDQVNLRNGDSTGKSLVDSGEGGAIFNVNGNVTVNGGTFSGNSASDEGGAIYNGGGLVVTGTVFTGNHAASDGGAVAAEANERRDLIHASTFNAEDVSTILTGSSFTKNTAEYGGAVYIDSPTAVAHCSFTGNTAVDDGGGVYVDNGSPTVTGSGFYQNQAGDDGGGIYNDDVVTVTGTGFRRNNADFGGGLYNDDQATVNGGTFAYNAARTDGGGFYNDDEATVNGSTFTANTARFGGGFYNDDVADISFSKIFRNTALIDGGGIFDNEHDVTLTNSTVSENHPDNCAPAGVISGCTG